MFVTEKRIILKCEMCDMMISDLSNEEIEKYKEDAYRDKRIILYNFGLVVLCLFILFVFAAGGYLFVESLGK